MKKTEAKEGIYLKQKNKDRKDSEEEGMEERKERKNEGKKERK